MKSDRDVRLRNQFVASLIVVAGLAIAFGYHLVQGRVLGHGYPSDTFLFLREIRFSDFTDVLRSAAATDPYSTWSIYFPFTYLAFRPLVSLPWWLSFTLLFGGSLGYIGVAFHRWLSAGGVGPVSSIPATASILGCSYPMLLCLDRGNIEIVLLALVVAFLFEFQNGHEWRSLVWLVPAICIKIYPAALLALFLQRRKYGHIVVAGFASAAITLAAFGMFERPVPEEIANFRHQLSHFREAYLVGNGSMGGSAGPWNAVKLLFLTATIPPDVRHVLMARPTLSEDLRFGIESILRAYSILTLALAVYLAFHVGRVEVDRERQAILLLLFMVLGPPGGADYKMIYVMLALTLTLRIDRFRPFERWLVPLLALTLVPKKYYFFPNVITDSGFADAPVSLIVNPALMMCAAVLLCASGWIAARGAATPQQEG